MSAYQLGATDKKKLPLWQIYEDAVVEIGRCYVSIVAMDYRLAFGEDVGFNPFNSASTAVSTPLRAPMLLEVSPFWTVYSNVPPVRPCASGGNPCANPTIGLRAMVINPVRRARSVKLSFCL
jgi:hypothetical protein